VTKSAELIEPPRQVAPAGARLVDRAAGWARARRPHARAGVVCTCVTGAGRWGPQLRDVPWNRHGCRVCGGSALPTSSGESMPSAAVVIPGCLKRNYVRGLPGTPAHAPSLVVAPATSGAGPQGSVLSSPSARGVSMASSHRNPSSRPCGHTPRVRPCPWPTTPRSPADSARSTPAGEA